MSDEKQARDKLWEMIKRTRFAMFVTVEPDGALRSRPMTPIQKEFDGNLWFFAKADTDVVRAVQANAEVCLTYGNSSAADFVSVSGHASVVTDVNQKRELWSTSVQAWLPEGPESPSVVLLAVRAQSGEYWNSENQWVTLFSVARALSTSTTPKNVGEHRKVAL